MASKMIGLFLLWILHAEHAAADSDETTKFDKAMAQALAFMPGLQAQRPATPGTSLSDAMSPTARFPSTDRSAMLNTMADLEARNQEMEVEYQRLRARIESQGDVESSVGPSASFHWLTGLVASISLAAISVAAVMKYTTQNQQGSESTTASQISLPLVPQASRRAGPIVATATVRAKDTSPAFEDLKDTASKLNPVLGYFDPLGLSRMDFWDQGNEATIGWLRHAEIKHGRVAMAGFIGYLVHENHIHWPWKMATAMPDTDWYKPFENLSAPDIWFNFPGEGRAQIILFMGFFEFWSESRYVLESEGQKHYMKGGKPGYFPTFDKLWHPVPFKLYDPFNFNKNLSEEVKADKLNKEINNGRLAMIGLMSLLCEAKIPGSVPMLASGDLGIHISKMSDGLVLMAPFGPFGTEVNDMVQYGTNFWPTGPL